MLKSRKCETAGRYYVAKDECVICGCCEGVAPDLFLHHPDTGISEVKRQPKTAEEFRQMFLAQRICMVDCIYYSGPDLLLHKYSDMILNCPELRGPKTCSKQNCPCFQEYLKEKNEPGP